LVFLPAVPPSRGVMHYEILYDLLLTGDFTVHMFWCGDCRACW